MQELWAFCLGARDISGGGEGSQPGSLMGSGALIYRREGPEHAGGSVGGLGRPSQPSIAATNGTPLLAAKRCSLACVGLGSVVGQEWSRPRPPVTAVLQYCSMAAIMLQPNGLALPWRCFAGSVTCSSRRGQHTCGSLTGRRRMGRLACGFSRSTRRARDAWRTSATTTDP
jgi:hypothetical protein